MSKGQSCLQGIGGKALSSHTWWNYNSSLFILFGLCFLPLFSKEPPLNFSYDFLVIFATGISGSPMLLACPPPCLLCSVITHMGGGGYNNSVWTVKGGKTLVAGDWQCGGGKDPHVELQSTHRGFPYLRSRTVANNPGDGINKYR